MRRRFWNSVDKGEIETDPEGEGGVNMLAVGAIIWIVCLVLNILLAQRKGRSVGAWVVLSIFFSWIALIINLVLPPKNR